MKKGMLLIFWGLMFLTLTIVKLPWEGLVWGFNMIGYGSVSYTHLDVYKRQAKFPSGDKPRNNFDFFAAPDSTESKIKGDREAVL